MGHISDKKFERSKGQDTPTNPGPKTDIKTNTVDFDEKTIKDQQNKR